MTETKQVVQLGRYEIDVKERIAASIRKISALAALLIWQNVSGAARLITTEPQR